MTKHLALAAVLSLALAGPAMAGSCPKEMAAIDAALAKSPKLTDAQMTQVKKSRADGETAHKAGKHEDSLKALAQAKTTLGLK